MVKQQIEYWHEKLWELVCEMETSPIDRVERAIWAELLEAIGVARANLRRLHGDWKNTEAFNRQKKQSNERRL